MSSIPGLVIPKTLKLELATSNLDSICITPDEVESVLLWLPLGKYNRILREIAREISPALSTFFNTSLRVGKVPDSFKEALVTSVLKGGDRSIVSNLRPISVYNNIDKSFERILFKNLYFLENNILTLFQSRFTSGDSTVSQPNLLIQNLVSGIGFWKRGESHFLQYK